MFVFWEKKSLDNTKMERASLNNIKNDPGLQKQNV